jgi:hypothetical protein
VPNDLPGASRVAPEGEDSAPSARVLARGDHEVRFSPRRQVVREVAEQPTRRRPTVRPPVEGQVVPTVGIALRRGRREVRRVREDDVKPPEPGSEVRADGVEGQSFAACGVPYESKRFGIEVGGDDARARAGRRERRDPAPRAYLEHREPTAALRVGDEQLGILAGRVHARGRSGRDAISHGNCPGPEQALISRVHLVNAGVFRSCLAVR